MKSQIEEKNKSHLWRIFRWILATVIFVLILILIFGFYLTTSLGENQLKSIVESQLSNALGQDVTVGKLETNLLTRLQIWKLEISEDHKGSVAPFVDLNKIEMHYSFWQFLFLNVNISSIQIDSLTVWALKDSNGFYNLPGFSSRGEEGGTTHHENSGISVALDFLAVNKGKFYFGDQTVPISGTLRHLSLLLERQTPNSYSFGLRSYSSNFTYENKEIPVDTMEIDGEWLDQMLKIASIRVKIPGFELTGNPSIDFAQPAPVLNGSLKLKGSPEALVTTFKENISPQLYPVNGQLDFAVDLSGTIDEPLISATALFPHLQVAEIAIANGEIDLHWSKDAISLRHFRAELMGGEIFGMGRVDMAAPLTQNIEFNIHGIDLAQAWRSLYDEVSPYQGKINGQLNSSGTVESIDSVQFLANLKMQRMMFKDKPLPDFDLMASVDRGIAKLDFHQAESEVKADIRFSKENLNGSFSIRIFKLEPFAGLFHLLGVRGSMSIQGSLSGKTDSPEIRVAFSANNVHYRNLPLDTLTGSIIYRAEQIHFGKTTFSGNLVEIDSLNPPLDLEKLRGGFSYQGRFEGSPDNLEGEFQLNSNNFSFRDYHADGLSVGLSASGKTVRLDNLQFSIDSLIVRSSGEYSLQTSHGALRLEFSELSKANIIQTVKPQIEAVIDLSDSSLIKATIVGHTIDLRTISKIIPQMEELGGDLDFKLDFTGTTKRPRADLKFVIMNPAFQQVRMDSIFGDVMLKTDFLYLKKLGLVTKGNRSWAEGKIQLRQAGESKFAFTENSVFDLSAEGDEIDLQLLNPILGNEMEIAGNCSYRFELDGDLKKPHINGELDIRAGGFIFAESSPAITGIEADINVQDTVLNFERFIGRIKNTPFKLVGKVLAMQDKGFNSDLHLSTSGREMISIVGIFTKDNINFSLKIDQFDMSYLQPFVPDLKDINGFINSNINVRGSFSKPELNGGLKILSLSFQPNMLDTKLNNGLMDLNFHGNRIKLDSLYLALNGGSILGAGNFMVENGEVLPLDVHTRVQNVKLNKPDEYLLTVNSARLDLKKQDNQYLLDGDIVLGETNLLYNFKPQAILPFTKQVEQPAQVPSAMMKQTRMNVRIRDSENIWVDNNLARIRLRSEVGLIGSLAQPNIGGRISVEEGYILYLDRKFQMERGTIDFVDPNRLNPIVDLEAKTSVTTYERLEATPYDITLRITGALEQAKVDLVSNPSLERSDIIALLTVGATRKQLTGKSSGGGEVSTTQILEQRIQTLSSKIISGYAGNTIERLFGLEDVSVQGNIFNSRKGGPQLVASKRISDSAKLTYTTRVGHLNEQGIRLDYRLSKRFSFEGQTDQEGESSLSIKYNMKFK
jgi:autotransporter translocation and assembly factor TamB